MEFRGDLTPRRAWNTNFNTKPEPSGFISLQVSESPQGTLPLIYASYILVNTFPAPTNILPPSGPTEISDGIEVSDELSVCSDSSYDTYANSATTPVDPRGIGSHAKTLTDQSGR